MSKVNAPGGGAAGVNFPTSRLSPTSVSPKNSFKNVLENTGKQATVKPENEKAVSSQVSRATIPASYSRGNDLHTLTALVQKGAPASKIVRTALQNNPIYQLLSKQRQNDMVKQLAQKVKEDPSLKIG